MSAFEEIQVGYTVRSTRNGVTREGIVEAIGPRSAHTKWPVVEIANVEDDSIEIVDRPDPFPLPTQHSLGWLSHAHFEDRLGFWTTTPSEDRGREWDAVSCLGTTVFRPGVTAFTEAVAVPKSALDELRRAYIAVNTNIQRGDAIYSFFAAIDNVSTR